MGFKTQGISQPSRFKRRGSSGLSKLSLEIDPRRIGPTSPSEPSPTAAPFNSTSFLIRQKSRDEEEQAPGALEQYGTNVGSIINRYSIVPDQDRCCHQHPSNVNLSNHDSRDDVSRLELQLQGLQVTDCPAYSGHRSTGHAGSTMKIDETYTARGQGSQAFQHRRVRSFTDDNFDLLNASNANACYDPLENNTLECL